MLMIAFTTRDRVSKCFCVEVVLARRQCPRDTSGKGESEGVKVLYAPPTSSYQSKQTVTPVSQCSCSDDITVGLDRAERRPLSDRHIYTPSFPSLQSTLAALLYT